MAQSHKKTVVIHSNFSKLFTGFGRTSRTLLRYLFKTGKYNLIEAANGLPFENDDTKRMPWTCHGTAPTQEQQQQIASTPDAGQREAKSRMAGYGYYGIDQIVEKYKPSAVLLQEDIWAFNEFDKKEWFKKTNPILWTTLDSLPIIQQAIDYAPVYDHFYVWASFAEDAFKRMGYSNIKTLHGCIDPTPFYNLGDKKRQELRAQFNIPTNTVILGTVSRNQLRKGFPQMIFAFKELKERNSQKNIKLFFHTSFREGFDIPKLAAESGVDLNDIYTTYFCRQCKRYEVRPFSGHEQDCKFCGGKGSVNTVDICHAVSDEQLNEIYNLFDIACLPLTSGGLEYFALESKLCEIPLLITNYSAGEDAVKENSGGFPLDWVEDVEIGSNFIKARTKISSIVEKVEWLMNLSKEERFEIGKLGRKYVLDNYSIEVIGKKWEAILDSLPDKEWSDEPSKHKNTQYLPPPNLSPEDFVIDLMTNMMNEKVDKNTSHVKNWAAHLHKSHDFQGVYKHFQNLAAQSNAQAAVKPVDLAELLDKDDESKRIAIVLPESAGDIVILNSMLNQFKALYPEYNIYFFTKPEFFPLVESHSAVHKVLVYVPLVDNIFFMNGNKDHKGYFSYTYYPAAQTQRVMAYQNSDNVERREW